MAYKPPPPPAQPGYSNAGAPPAQPGYVQGPVTPPPASPVTRTGAGHFGNPIPLTPEQKAAEMAAHPEARSGAAHFGASPAAPTGPTPGTESGPGILEQWFNQRASGTDPGYEYALGRGMSDINNQFAARGGYNSGGAIRALSDYQANMGSQREAQLDALAGGASGEHQGRLDAMFNQGMGLAGGQAGLAQGYDTSAGNAMNAGNLAAIQLALDKAGVDSKYTQSILSNLFSFGGLLGGKGGGGGGGGGDGGGGGYIGG